MLQHAMQAKHSSSVFKQQLAQMCLAVVLLSMGQTCTPACRCGAAAQMAALQSQALMLLASWTLLQLGH